MKPVNYLLKCKFLDENSELVIPHVNTRPPDDQLRETQSCGFYSSFAAILFNKLEILFVCVCVCVRSISKSIVVNQEVIDNRKGPFINILMFTNIDNINKASFS